MADDKELAVATWERVVLGSRVVRGLVRDTLHDLGIRGPQFHVLRILDEAGPDGLKLSEVSQRMNVTGGSVTNLIDHLEERGYATRRVHPSDRRVWLACLTEQGREVLDVVAPVWRRHVSEALSCLSPEEMEHLGEMMARVVQHVQGDLAPGQTTSAGCDRTDGENH